MPILDKFCLHTIRDDYMKYIIMAPLQLICLLLCYLTNWIVVFFATEEGELNGILRLWQTWDDTLDNKSFIESNLPGFLNYNWDEHYTQYKIIDEYNRTRYKEKLIKSFSDKDKIKRYICRVAWLYRNCAYGFAYYLFGVVIKRPTEIKQFNPKAYFIYEKCMDFWNVNWAIKFENKIIGNFYWNIYLGWKISKSISYCHRAMIATRIWIRYKKEDE